MKRFLIAITCLVAASAVAQTAEPPHDTGTMLQSISVSGTETVRLTPDRVSFTVGVQTVGRTVDDAVRENNSKVSAVIAALKKAGATEREIRTSNFSIYPQQDYQQGKPPRILGYQVSNNVTVTRSNVTDAGKLLQAAVDAGVNTSTGLQFSVSDRSRGMSEGLRGAFDDARAKATILAQAAGRTLGRAISISEGGAAPPPMPYAVRTMAAKAESGEVPVESGTQELTFSVSVVFELR